MLEAGTIKGENLTNPQLTEGEQAVQQACFQDRQTAAKMWSLQEQDSLSVHQKE